MSQSMTLFVVMVSFAAIGCLLAMVGLAGGYRRLPGVIPKNVSVDSVALVVLLVAVVFLLGLMYRRWTAKAPTRARVNEHQPVRQTAAKLPSTSTKAAIAKHAAVATNSGGGTAQPLRPAIPPAVSVSPNLDGGHPLAKVVQAKPLLAKVQRTDVPKPVRQSAASTEPPAKSVSIVVHGPKVLSDPQAKRVCNAVSPFAGAEVYIKWSPGGNAEQLASQLSQVLDCARVTVTYASETPGMQGHGVRVGTHANEGETSDRIRPFADAITEALRAQGFNVSEVTGSNIPANQTAIFIGSD